MKSQRRSLFIFTLCVLALVGLSTTVFAIASSKAPQPQPSSQVALVQTVLHSLYDHEIFTQHGLQLKFDWSEDDDQSFPSCEIAGTEFRITFGRLLETQVVPIMSKEVLAFSLCHEIGHLLGGEPRKLSPSPHWSSAEAQADYFAATSCLPRVLREFKLRSQIDETEIQNQVLGAAFAFFSSLSNMLASFGGEAGEFYAKPSWIQPSLPAVETTNLSYPSISCRWLNIVSAVQKNERSSCWYKEPKPISN